MREVTENMIKKYMIIENGFDFMGYRFNKIEELSFHHLIVQKSKCDEFGINGGYYEWNGAILVKLTAHNYLHLIEKLDRNAFLKITDVLIDENIKGCLDIKNLREIHNQLIRFERCFGNERTSNGEFIIKEGYYKRLIKCHGLRK